MVKPTFTVPHVLVAVDFKDKYQSIQTLGRAASFNVCHNLDDEMRKGP